MPCSILSEVTITVIGSAISSFSFIQFDFLESFFLPGASLSDDSLFRVFIVHAAAPTIALIATIDHLNHLHSTEYTDEDEMDSAVTNRYEY
jgi:quinol-cytochrome oxidoreductase complex cytochrome b subunit